MCWKCLLALKRSMMGDREFCRVFAFRSVFFSVVVFESRIDADRVSLEFSWIEKNMCCCMDVGWIFVLLGFTHSHKSMLCSFLCDMISLGECVVEKTRSAVLLLLLLDSVSLLVWLVLSLIVFLSLSRWKNRQAAKVKDFL